MPDFGTDSSDGPPDPQAEHAETSTLIEQEVERLVAQLESESRGRYPLMHIGCLFAMGIPLGLFTVCAGGVVPWVGATSIIVGGLFLLLLSRLTVSARQKELLARLRDFQDMRAVGPFLTALYWPGMEEHRYSLQIALRDLLPRMKASDARLLKKEYRAALYRVLRDPDDALALAALKALEQVGTAEAIPYVEGLVRRRAWTPRQKRIQAAAEACLPTLYTRVSQTGERLVRPAADPGPPEATLLRPASSGAGAAETLLRPDEARPADAEGKRADKMQETDVDGNIAEKGGEG